MPLVGKHPSVPLALTSNRVVPAAKFSVATNSRPFEGLERTMTGNDGGNVKAIQKRSEATVERKKNDFIVGGVVLNKEWGKKKDANDLGL